MIVPGCFHTFISPPAFRPPARTRATRRAVP